jgi:glycosyltransferase involved in cell wall biosynthesis
MNYKRKILVIFNLAMDLDNPILATTNLWVNEFSKHFDSVYVYSTHLGRYQVSPNVKVTELGGGSLIQKVRAIGVLCGSLRFIIGNSRNIAIFHHQSPRTAVFPGLFVRALGIPQGLWYSHSSKPPTFRIGKSIVNYVFSSSKESLPIHSTNSIFLSHGIDVDRALASSRIKDNPRKDILFVGRISPIKMLQECITAINDSGEVNLGFTVVGPVGSNTSYQDELKRKAQKMGVKLKFEKEVKHDLVFETMSKFSMFYAGMKNSVDKSCLEAAASGCLIVTTDEASARLSGMKEFWFAITGIDELPKLSDQIRMINTIDERLIEGHRLEVQSRTVSRNSVATLIKSISEKLV